jgi:hypothetical protein
MSISLLLALVGVVLLASALFDLLVTILTMDGGGRISNWLSHHTSKLVRKLSKVVGGQRVLMLGGSLALSVVILFWLAATWFGWALIFGWDAMAISKPGAVTPVTFTDQLYYAGYTITTVGYGDFRAASTLGQLASVIAGINGLALFTLGITYGIQVITAVVEKRQLALLLNAAESVSRTDSTHVQEEPTDFLRELSKLDSNFAGVAQKYLAFPIIHCFPDRNPQTALPLKIAALWCFIDALSLRQDHLSASARVQLKKSGILLRSLVTNAVESHGWRKRSNRTPVGTRKPEPLESLVRDYVHTAGWNWGRHVKH